MLETKFNLSSNVCLYLKFDNLKTICLKVKYSLKVSRKDIVKGIYQLKYKRILQEYFNATKLNTQHYVNGSEIVEDLIPIGIGVTLFGIPQKIGETFFALQLADEIAKELKEESGVNINFKYLTIHPYSM